MSTIEKVFFWIGVACTGLSTLMVIGTILIALLGYFVRKIKLAEVVHIGETFLQCECEKDQPTEASGGQS